MCFSSWGLGLKNFRNECKGSALSQSTKTLKIGDGGGTRSRRDDGRGRDDGFSVRSVVVLRMRTSRKVFVKGMYIEDVDVKEREDAEPVENLDTAGSTSASESVDRRYGAILTMWTTWSKA